MRKLKKQPDLGNQGLKQSFHRQCADLQALGIPFEVDVCCVNARHVSEERKSNQWIKKGGETNKQPGAMSFIKSNVT